MTTLVHTVDALRAAHSAASIVLAAAGDPTNNTDDEGGENQKAGPLGLAVILLLCVASYFLFRSMSRRLRNVREKFPTEPIPPRPATMPTARPADEPTGEPVQRITSLPEASPPDSR
jgi:hypothetical protein